MRRKNVIILALTMLIAILLAACGNDEPASETSLPPQKDYYEIETSRGVLLYPDQWEKLVFTEETQEEDAVNIRFYTKINDTEYSLFSLRIGGDGEPDVVWSMDDGTQQNVFVTIHPLELEEDLDEGDVHRLYAMQEDINYVLDHMEDPTI